MAVRTVPAEVTSALVDPSRICASRNVRWCVFGARASSRGCATAQGRSDGSASASGAPSPPTRYAADVPPVARARHRYTYEEYLAYERDSELKHEYDDGEILAMAGGPRRHSALALRVGAAIDRVRQDGCNAFPSEGARARDRSRDLPGRDSRVR